MHTLMPALFCISRNPPSCCLPPHHSVHWYLPNPDPHAGFPNATIGTTWSTTGGVSLPLLPHHHYGNFPTIARNSCATSNSAKVSNYFPNLVGHPTTWPSWDASCRKPNSPRGPRRMNWKNSRRPWFVDCDTIQDGQFFQSTLDGLVDFVGNG